MRTNGARTWSLTAAVILLAPTGSVGLAGAPAPAADSVADGANEIVQGVEATIKSLGKTLADSVTVVEQRAKAAGTESKPAGAKLEKSAQGFGESIWDGMKSVGRSLQRFFTGG